MLVFTLGGQRFAVPAEHIRRIEYPAPLTRVPGGPRWLQGLANLMGEVVAVVDTRRWLGLAETPPLRGLRWLVLAYEGDLIALTIDELPMLQVAEHQACRPLPSDDPRRRCLAAELNLGGDPVALLDLSGLLAESA
jgi:chemotaxis signal transduction protein